MTGRQQQATTSTRVSRVVTRPGHPEATLGRSIVVGHVWPTGYKGRRSHGEIATPRRPSAGRSSTTVGRMAFHDITMTSITGEQVSFDDYRGKLALVVNVASA